MRNASFNKTKKLMDNAILLNLHVTERSSKSIPSNRISLQMEAQAGLEAMVIKPLSAFCLCD